MTSLGWSIVEINLIILAVFGGYLFIRKFITIAQQRWILMCLPLVAIAVTLLKSVVGVSNYAYQLGWIELETIVVGPEASVGVDAAFSWGQVYGIGVVFFGLLFAFRMLRLLFFFKRHKALKRDEYFIYGIHGTASFSFFNRIQIAPELDLKDQQIVLEHEKIHGDKKHSIDILIMELFHAFCWFNPVFFLIKRELINVHEFEVDALMYKKHKVAYMQFLLNYALGINASPFLLTSQFYNQLTLKKRILNMKTKKGTQKWALALIPALFLLATLVQCAKNDPGPATESDAAAISETVYDMADVEPEFVGGSAAMVKFIGDHVEYPKKLAEEGVEGTVFVQFVISSKGEVKDVEIAKGVHELMDKEAVEVIQSMPKWIPGQKDGKAVAVKFTLPISFKLS